LSNHAVEEYCQDRFGMKRRHPYRLIDAAKVVDNILEVCPNETHKSGDTNQQLQIVPTSERQARPLTKLSPAEQREAWDRAVELAGNKVPSGKIVSQVVSKILCLNGTQIKYKIGQKIKIKSNHSLFGGSSGIIKQMPNHTEVIVKLDNGQTEPISNEYIQLELDSSIDAPAYTKALAPRRPLGQELPIPGIAYGAFCVGSFPHKSRLTKQELVWSIMSGYLRKPGKSLILMQSMKEQLVWMGRSRDC
jgi:hypothetical protein